MTRNYRKYDEDFKQGAVRLVVETGKPIAWVARERGVNEGTLGNWCAKSRGAAGPRGRGVERDSGPSWLGCGRRTASCGCSVMCSSVPGPWKTPAEAFNEQLSLLQQAGVASTG